MEIISLTNPSGPIVCLCSIVYPETWNIQFALGNGTCFHANITVKINLESNLVTE